MQRTRKKIHVSVVENRENPHLLDSTQCITQPDASQTSVFQEPHLISLQYGNESLNVSDSLEYDWQFSGHFFIGERISRLYPNGQSAVGTVQKYLPSDGDKEDLDIHECFVAMEQYCKKISRHNLNSAFAGHLESRVVTINRLMRFSRSILLELSHYLDMEVVNGSTKTVLSKNILTA
jgi:hypothetical protein